MIRKLGHRAGLTEMFRLASVLFALLLWSGCGGGSGPKRAVPTPSAPVETAFVRTVAEVPTDTAPVDVAVADDAVWVANSAAGTVNRIDPATGRRTGRPIDVGAAPVAIAAGAGSVWVARATGSVVRIDPATNAVVGDPQQVADPGGIDAVGDQVWVSSRAAGTVQRLDGETGRAVGAPVRVGAGPTDVAIGDGTVWVAGSGDGTVTPVDVASGTAGDPIQISESATDDDTPAAAGARVLGLALGEGGVWVAYSDGSVGDVLRVREIDPAKWAVIGDAIPVTGGNPMHLAAGGGGVWVTDVGTALPGGRARAPGLLRIDPGTRSVAGRPLHLGAGPAGLAVGTSGVWVAESGANRVRHIGAAG